jgi:hypothetical protein
MIGNKSQKCFLEGIKRCVIVDIEGPSMIQRSIGARRRNN